MEMLWRTSDAENASTTSDGGHAIFTGVLFKHYSPPDGFNWDLPNSDTPIMDYVELDGFNVPQRVREFLAVVEEQVTSSLLISMSLGAFYQRLYAN